MIKNRNIDIVRALALLLVIVYHCWVRLGSISIPNGCVQLIIRLGGEIGVTAFFALSGYGIYQSIYYTENAGGEIKFLPFLKKRLKRILPQYYLNLIVALFLTSAAVYLGRQHIWNIVSHFLLLHNNFLYFAGAINGVLWTMGVTFQFYLIVIPMYKVFRKIGIWSVPLGTLFTVLCKFIAFQGIPYIWEQDNYSIYSFWLGRQIIFTDLDNFLIGMAVAYYTKHFKEIDGKVSVVGCVVSLGLLYCVCKLGVTYGIHTNNISGYFWHSEVAFVIGLIMLFANYVGGKHKNYVSKTLLWLSKYEYGIYLWHLMIIDNIISNSPLIQELINSGNYIFVAIIFIIVSIVAGVLFTKLTNFVVERK